MKFKWIQAQPGFIPIIGKSAKVGKRQIGMETHDVFAEIIQVDEFGNFLVRYAE